VTVLNDAQIAQLAYNAGFRGQGLATAIAITHAESGARTDALNNNAGTGDYSVGLWQINYLPGHQTSGNSLYNERTSKYGDPNSLIADPQAQAAAAYDISGHGSNFSPWTTYTSGAYRQYLLGAEGAAAAISGVATVGGLGSGVNPGTDYTATLASATTGSGVSDTTDSSDVDGNKILFQIPIPIPGIPSFHFMRHQGRAVLGGICLLAGGAIVLLGLAKLMGADAAQIKKVAGAAGGVIPGAGGAISNVATKTDTIEEQAKTQGAPKSTRDQSQASVSRKESEFFAKNPGGKSVSAKELDDDF
jgi:hypothetical protein